MDWKQHIHSDETILSGKPVVRGTRISVELILEFIADGCSVADVIAAYPHLSEAQVRSALAFAHDMIAEEKSIAKRRAA
jgi:uncharacterized protein (DUF433 family)